MTKVYITPQFKGSDNIDGGIRRVIEAMVQYLPDYGVEVVDSVSEADVVNAHAMEVIETDKPYVFTGPTTNGPIVTTSPIKWLSKIWPAPSTLPLPRNG